MPGLMKPHLSELRTTEPPPFGLRERLRDLLSAIDTGGGAAGALRRLGGLLAAIGQRGAQRLVAIAWSGPATRLLDALDERRGRPDSVIRMEIGEDPAPESRSLAVFIHFSPDGTLTDMVLRQVETYRDLGFATVLVSNSPRFPEASWRAARQRAALVVHRSNAGLDFGAWKDVLPIVLARWPGTDEILLVNDSVLGPIRPLLPALSRMRDGGPGFYGMIESLQGGVHLQSWFTLARGRKAVDDLADFLATLRLSRSKARIIERGELRLARAMRDRGNRVAALYGYDALVEMAVSDPEHAAYLRRALPHLRFASDPVAMRAGLLRRPLNPALHLWRVLAGPAACPFIKTELVRRNPAHLPGVDVWPGLVPADSPCTVEMLKAHLAAMGP